MYVLRKSKNSRRREIIKSGLFTIDLPREIIAMSYEDTFDVPEAAKMTTSEMIRTRFGHDDSASITSSVCDKLKELYESIVKPVEVGFGYDRYKARPIASSYFDSKPIIMGMFFCNFSCFSCRTKTRRENYLH